MAAEPVEYRVTFAYLEPAATADGAKLVSTEVTVAPGRDYKDWDNSDLESFAGILTEKMRDLGDEGPFHWRLTPLSGSSHLWTFEVRGKTTLTAPVFPLNEEQLPKEPLVPKSIG
jgi:hypothetical protein